MADGIVGLPADSTGKKVRTFEVTVGANTVEQQVVSVAKADGTPDVLGSTVADGANVVEGATTDAAVTSDAGGSLSAKLRGLVKILSSVWDSVNGRLKVDGSGVTQPISVPAGTALTVHGEADVFKQILMELRTANKSLQLLTGTEISDKDVEVQ